MSNDPLAPSFAKIKRAETHIKDLNAAVRAFVETSPYRLVSQINSENTEERWSIEIDCLPDEIGAIAADAIHNLRMPLDKMLTIGADKNRLRKIKFPTGDTRGSFESSLANQRKNLPQSVIDFLQKTEAYSGGKGSLFFVLHDIDNGDKHHPIVVPISTAVRTKEIGGVEVRNGSILVLGSRRGQHLVSIDDSLQFRGALCAPSDDARPMLRAGRIPGEHVLEFISPHDDLEVFTTTPRANVKAKVEPSLNVAFNKVEGFEGKPIVNVLHRMRDLVKATLKAFQREFF